MAEEVLERASRSGQRLALERKRRAADDAVVDMKVCQLCAPLIPAMINWK
jgi:hypothetical protein